MTVIQGPCLSAGKVPFAGSAPHVTSQVWPAVERQAGVEERWGVLGPIVRPFISIPGFFL